MLKVSQLRRTAPATDDLKGRIESFLGAASTEITPSEEGRVSELASVLPAGTAVYVAHTPNERIAKKEILEAVELYVQVAKTLLA